MGINGIFALFGFPEKDDEGKEDVKIKKEINDYKKTPYFKMGMFLKLIMNGNIFKKQIISFFSKSDPFLDSEGIDDAGEFMMYNILSSKRTQLESEVIISDSQSCIDEVEAYLRSEQKKNYLISTRIL